LLRLCSTRSTTSRTLQLIRLPEGELVELTTVLEIEPETSDPKASQLLATLYRPDAQFSTA